MHRLFLALIAAVAVAASAHRTSAQTLTVSLLERYLESLREQAGIPGMSALVLQDGGVLWDGGFGRADVDALVPATALTPYPIAGLSQMFGATLLLRSCYEDGLGGLSDPVSQYVPTFPEPTTVGQLLAHVGGPSGAFAYDLTRFAALTAVIEKCAGVPYPQLLAEEILGGIGMLASVPGTALATPTPQDLELFGAPNLGRYAQVLADMAKGYRVDGRGRPTRTTVAPARVDAATGLVATVRDLARFDGALTLTSGSFLLRPETVRAAWQPAAPGLPAGLGWFFQVYNGEPVVWQYGQVKDAYSALLVRVPHRRVTFILLANSDALAAPFGREPWDVTASAFARVFLRIFVP